jgi:hypothetical protein
MANRIGRCIVSLSAEQREELEALQLRPSVFKPEATLTPFGIFLPQSDDLWLYMACSKVTSDFIVDRLEQWWQEVRLRFLDVKTLVINLDNGPENHSRRAQFLKRIVAFAEKSGLRIHLAYYPPYHSKSNPIERCWGILEMHWNGSLLDSITAVLGFARTMSWKGKHPQVTLIETAYSRGVRLSPSEMATLESQVTRLPSLGYGSWRSPGRPERCRNHGVLLGGALERPAQEVDEYRRPGELPDQGLEAGGIPGLEVKLHGRP